MTEQEFFVKTGQLASVKDILALKKEVGFLRLVSSFSEKIRYSVRLWIIRECRIIQILIENYDKIPKSPSRLIISIFARSAYLRSMIDKIGRKSQNKILLNI